VPDLRGLGAFEVIGEQKFLLLRDRCGRDGRQIGSESSRRDEDREGQENAHVHWVCVVIRRGDYTNHPSAGERKRMCSRGDLMDGGQCWNYSCAGLTIRQAMSPQLQDFREWVAAVRAKPGLYLGAAGTEAVSRAICEILQVIIIRAPKHYKGPVNVFVSQAGRISVHFTGLAMADLDPDHVQDWYGRFFSDRHLAMLPIALGFSDECSIESADGKRKALWKFSDETGVVTKRTSRRGTPSLKISFTPVSDLGRSLTRDHLYGIGSMLKDLSLLRSGLGTALRADALAGELHYFHEQGLRSFLFEEDYARWSLHPECLSFKGRAQGMKVEGHLRFLHAGTPHVRNWVNLHPTQGGAHLEGLGDALGEMFPDADMGCRALQFITNSNIGAYVRLPHSFIGAVRVDLDDPRYDGPTKDILLGDDVRRFVRDAALEHLPEQWTRLRKRGA
jgi:DNA gyrase/topoisomerase IV subunit B